MKRKKNIEIEKEAMFGIVPVLQSEKIYGFLDALLVLSGYCIATWSYTQGSYLISLVGFKQLLIGAFLGAILMLLIYQLPVILSVRYGIDIWIWLRSVFGHFGVKIMTVIIIIINYPWYAVCADLFASSMTNLLNIFGISLPSFSHGFLAVICVLAGTFIAYRGLGAITWTTRVLVPLLLLVGMIVVCVGFSSVPFDVIWNFKPDTSSYSNNIIPYIVSIEANFAFVITLVGGMAEVPRLTKSEKSGFFAGVIGQGVSGSFFVVVGAVMAIAMQYVTFIDLGKGKLIHNSNGFYLTFTDYGESSEKTMFFSKNSMTSVHTEYDYRGKGQCITLSTLDNTYFIFPKGHGFNATKIQFATEYLYMTIALQSADIYK